MKTTKIILLIVGLLSICTAGYSQLTFTINSTNGFTLTCNNPTLLLQATSNYTPTQPTYTFVSPSNQIYTMSTVSAVEPGTWTVTAAAGSLIASQTIAIVINTVVPTLTLTASATSITCFMPSVTLSATVNPANVQLIWVEPGVGMGCTTTTCVASISGNYGLKIKDPTNGCINIATISVADGRTYPSLSASSLFTLACPGGTVDLSPTVNGGTIGLVFQWTIPMGANTNGTNSAVLNTDAPGTYTVVITNTVSGCNAITLVNVWACVGINEIQKEKIIFTVSPNPVKDKLILEFENNNSQSYTLSVISPLGQLIFQSRNLSQKQELDLSFLSAGVYYLMVQSVNQQEKIAKLIKE